MMSYFPRILDDPGYHDPILNSQPKQSSSRATEGGDEQNEYQRLVNMLANPMIPETRAMILLRLTEINNQLLMDKIKNVPCDFSRTAEISHRKSDINENTHPSLSRCQRFASNPIPIDFSLSRSPDLSRSSDLSRLPNLSRPSLSDRGYRHQSILDPYHTDSPHSGTSLDDKLSIISNLYQKIIAEKKKKKREKKNAL